MEAQSVATLRVVINNPQIGESVVKRHFASLSVPVRLLRHDNTGLEFGAYQRGLDDLRRTGADDLPCLFTNDTVGSHYPITTFNLRKFSSAAQQHLGSNAIVGLVDWSAPRLQLCGLHTSRWVRSDLFVMDRQALQSIGNELYVARLDACIHRSDVPDDRAGTAHVRHARTPQNFNGARRLSMQNEQIREIITAHWRASAAGDLDAEHDIYDDGAICDYPQSGERIVGRINLQALRGHHPDKPSGFDVKRIQGEGNLWITEYTITYKGRATYTVSIMEFCNGKVVHETQYFSDPFKAPDWRSQWVQQAS